MQTCRQVHLAARSSDFPRPGRPRIGPCVIVALRASWRAGGGPSRFSGCSAAPAPATRRARLGPRLTCALHRAVFMHVHKAPGGAPGMRQAEVRRGRLCMRIYAPCLCADNKKARQTAGLLRKLETPQPAAAQNASIGLTARFASISSFRRFAVCEMAFGGLAGDTMSETA